MQRRCSGIPTGVGAFCQGALAALAQRPGVDVRAYAVSWRRRRLIEAKLPDGVAARQRPMPARPLHALWTRGGFPPLEWFIGATDVVHGTNFLVPPTGRAAAGGLGARPHAAAPSRTVQCGDARLPGLIRRALDRGAWVHTDSAFVARRGNGGIRCRSVARPCRNPGIPDLPVPADAEAVAVLRRFLPPGVERYCLAIGTAEPRKDLPGLVRAFGAVAERQPDVALVLAGPPGWGEQALASAIAATGRARGSSARVGWSSPIWRRCSRGQPAGLPLSLRGLRLPAVTGHARRGARRGDRAGSLPEVLGDGAACWSRWAITTVWSRRWSRAWATRWSAAASSRRGRPGRRAIHGSVAVTSSRRSIVMRRPAVASRPAVSVLLAAEQLRRRVPGGIGVYARGLLGGLAVAAAEGDGVEVALLASRAPAGAADPLAAFGRPLHTSRLPSRLLTRAWDRGLTRAPAGFDVVHSVSLASPQLRRSSPERLVVTVHDVAWRRYPEATTRRGRVGTRRPCAGPAGPKLHSWCRPGSWRPT